MPTVPPTWSPTRARSTRFGPEASTRSGSAGPPCADTVKTRLFTIAATGTPSAAAASAAVCALFSVSRRSPASPRARSFSRNASACGCLARQRGGGLRPGPSVDPDEPPPAVAMGEGGVRAVRDQLPRPRPHVVGRIADQCADPPAVGDDEDRLAWVLLGEVDEDGVHA